MNRPDIILRAATAADAPIIADLIHAAFNEYAGAIDPPSSAHKENAETIRALLETEHAALAYIDEQAVACVVYRDQGEQIYFGRLSVLPEYRQHGIARQLVAYVEARAQALGRARVQLNVRVALRHLRSYYERLGYRVVAECRHAGYTVTTYLVMEKRI